MIGMRGHRFKVCNAIMDCARTVLSYCPSRGIDDQNAKAFDTFASLNSGTVRDNRLRTPSALPPNKEAIRRGGRRTGLISLGLQELAHALQTRRYLAPSLRSPIVGQLRDQSIDLSASPVAERHLSLPLVADRTSASETEAVVQLSASLGSTALNETGLILDVDLLARLDVGCSVDRHLQRGPVNSVAVCGSISVHY